MFYRHKAQNARILEDLFMNLICLKCARAACTCGLLAWLAAASTQHDFPEEHVPNTAASAALNSTATSLTASTTYSLEYVVPDTVADGAYSTLPYMEPLTKQQGDGPDEAPLFVLMPRDT
jgi:hypothetical protein